MNTNIRIFVRIEGNLTKIYFSKLNRRRRYLLIPIFKPTHCTIIINCSPVKCALYFLTLERHDDQDRIVTVIIVQVPDTFAQEALASTPPLTRRASTKILYPLYFWTLSNQC